MSVTSGTETRYAAIIHVRGRSGRMFTLATPDCDTREEALEMAGSALFRIDGDATVIDIDVVTAQELPDYVLRIVPGASA